MGLVLSLSFASFDLILCVVFVPLRSLADPAMTTTFFAGTVVAILLIYALLWLLIGLPLRCLLKLPVLSLSVGLASGLALPVFTTIMSDGSWELKELLSPYYLTVSLGVMVGVGLLAYFLTSLLNQGDERVRLLGRACLLAPVALMELLAVVWLRFYWVRGPFSAKSTVFLLLALAAVAGTCRWLSAPRALARVPLLLAGAAVIAVVTGTVRLLTLTPTLDARGPVFSQDHRVKRVVLITVDTLRRNAVLAGGSATDSPNIDALAEDSIVFTNAYAPAPWTPPSIASMMTGLSPWAHSVSRMEPSYPPEPPYLSDLLLDAGYATAAFGANPLVTHQRALSRSFQTFHFPERGLAKTFGIAVLSLLAGPVRMSDQHWTEKLTAMGETWVDSHRDDDFFLWLHYFDPHSPYLPPREFIPDGPDPPGLNVGVEFERKGLLSRFSRYSPRQKRWLRDLYRAEVRYVDDRIGRLIDTLKKLGLFEESLIVLTSDHGEEFWEHGGVRHGHSFYNEVLGVPLLVKLPRSLATAPRRVDGNVSTVSVTPTVLELCGLSFNAAQFSAPSLVPLFYDDVAQDQPPVFSTHPSHLEDREAIAQGRWKYIRFEHVDREELYDLEADPSEQMNIAAREPERTETLEALISEHRLESEQLKRRYGIGRRASAEERRQLREQLRSLGYIQ